MATLTDVINQVIEDTGRYELNDSATLKANLVETAQRFLEDYLTPDLMTTFSKQFTLTTGIYGQPLGRCQSIVKAWVSETNSFRNDLIMTEFGDLLSYANTVTSTGDSRGVPLYIARGRMDGTTFNDGFLASPNFEGFIVFPVPDRTVTIRIQGDFLPDLLTDASPTDHLFLTTYRHLFVLALKAQLEFGIRNIEGFNQYKSEMIERITALDMQNVRTSWAGVNVMEDL